MDRRYEEARLLLKEGRQLGMEKLREAEKVAGECRALLPELVSSDRVPWEKRLDVLDGEIAEAIRNEEEWEKRVREKEEEIRPLERRAVNGDDQFSSDVNQYIFKINRLLKEESLRKGHQEKLEGFRKRAVHIQEEGPPTWNEYREKELIPLLSKDPPLVGQAMAALERFLGMNIKSEQDRQDAEAYRKEIRKKANDDFHNRYEGAALGRPVEGFEGDPGTHFEAEEERDRGTPPEEKARKLKEAYSK